jgi:outer membrane protein assembly factor BamB
VRVVGVSDGVAVVTLSQVHSVMQEAALSISFGVDLGTREVLWEKDLFNAEAVSGDAVVGGSKAGGSNTDVLTGLSLQSGEQLWRDGREVLSAIAVTPAGPDLVLTTGTQESFYGPQPDGRVVLLDPATGEATRLLNGITPSSCRYDEDSVVVCAYTPTEEDAEAAAFALDAETGELLWRLPDESGSRIAPQVTAVWHGMVYGNTADGPVVMDARTGEDVELEPGIAPQVVNEYAGIAVPEPAQDGGTSPRQPTVHPAAG